MWKVSFNGKTCVVEYRLSHFSTLKIPSISNFQIEENYLNPSSIWVIFKVK